MSKFRQWGPFAASVIQIIGFVLFHATPHEHMQPLPEPMETFIMPTVALAYGALLMWGLLRPFESTLKDANGR